MTRRFVDQPQQVGLVGAVLAALLAAVLFIACAWTVSERKPLSASEAPTAGLTAGIGVGVTGP